MPPVKGEYAYYSKRILDYSGDLFYCVRPNWVVNTTLCRSENVFIHFTSKKLIPDEFDCVFLGACVNIQNWYLNNLFVYEEI